MARLMGDVGRQMKVGCQDIPDLRRRKTTTIEKGYQQTFPGSQGLKVRNIGAGVVMHSVLTVDHDAAAANHLVLAPAKDAHAIVPDAA
jgi:uncharacterized RmlC-like cupin family protein